MSRICFRDNFTGVTFMHELSQRTIGKALTYNIEGTKMVVRDMATTKVLQSWDVSKLGSGIDYWME